MTKDLSLRRIILWIVSLAFLAVGARNFEQGLTIDGPLYATIARNIARTGELFRMDGYVPDFIPYAEHTHLGFWWHALFLKILPTSDWAVRIPNHLFYVGFLLLFFLWLRRYASQAVAVWAVLLLWCWPIFANFYSNVYLDPGALFFGSLAMYSLWRSSQSLGEPSNNKVGIRWPIIAGLSLGACALYKGLTVLGFGPVCAYLVLDPKQRISFSARLKITLITCAVFAGIFGLYALALSKSSVPDFLHIYWQRQIAQRFGRSWNWRTVLNPGAWNLFLRDTHGLLLLAPFACLMAWRGRLPWQRLLLPGLWALSFVLMYFPADRIGAQYWMLLMPPFAWLIAEALASLLPLGERSVRVTQAFALLAVFVVQYLPYRTHAAGIPSEPTVIHSLRAQGHQVDSLCMDSPAPENNFISGARFAWYGDVRIFYVNREAPVPKALARQVYVMDHPSAARITAVQAAGWHLFFDQSPGDAFFTAF